MHIFFWGGHTYIFQTLKRKKSDWTRCELRCKQLRQNTIIFFKCKKVSSRLGASDTRSMDTLLALFIFKAGYKRREKESVSKFLKAVENTQIYLVRNSFNRNKLSLVQALKKKKKNSLTEHQHRSKQRLKLTPACLTTKYMSIIVIQLNYNF